MRLHSPTEHEIALTPSLSQWTGRASFRSKRVFSLSLARWRKREGEGLPPELHFRSRHGEHRAGKNYGNLPRRPEGAKFSTTWT